MEDNRKRDQNAYWSDYATEDIFLKDQKMQLLSVFFLVRSGRHRIDQSGEECVSETRTTGTEKYSGLHSL